MPLKLLIKTIKRIATMFKQIIEKPKTLYITFMLLSATTFGVEGQMNAAHAQSSMQSSCYQAFENYNYYNQQPVGSPMEGGFSSHNMIMANQALNTVTDCAIKYSQLVSQDSSYCSEAEGYMETISPIMSTAATTIMMSCQNF
ncbi:MAG: hypothetical protein ACRC80_16400 [Waterburya sp.]